jgi:hypothetical protein
MSNLSNASEVSLNGFTYSIVDGFVQCPYGANASARYSNFYDLAAKYNRSVVNEVSSPYSGKLMFVAI